MYYILDNPKKSDPTYFSSVPSASPGTLDVFEQLQQEARLSDFLALRERDRRRKDRERPHVPDKHRKKSDRTFRRTASTPAMRWLNERICSLVYGEGTPVGVRPSVEKAGLVGRWNLGISMPRLANYRMADHFKGEKTYYFFGNGNPKDEFTLAMIDIDVAKSKGLGTPAGALAFAEHLKGSHFPELYFERSTGGKGIHAYVLVRKLGGSATEVNAGLRRFQVWLRAEAKRVSADIEMVEVKGGCLELTFRYRLLESAKYGSLGKLPREVHRFDEWQATTVLRLADLTASKYDVMETVAPVCVPALATPVRATKPKMQVVAGSVSGKVISDEELASLCKFEAMYSPMTGGKPLKAGKFAITAHDFAVSLVLLRYFKRKPNSDGSLPTDRVAELWTGLFNADDVQRPWNHHRWKAIRDFLSRNGHIHWLENRYQYGDKVNGKFVRGLACKFSLTDEFADSLEQIAAVTVSSPGGGASLMDTAVPDVFAEAPDTVNVTIFTPGGGASLMDTAVPDVFAEAPDTVNVTIFTPGGGASLMDTAVALLIPPRGRGRFLVPERYPIRAETERLFWKAAYEACETLCAA